MTGRPMGKRAPAGQGTLAACWYTHEVAGKTDRSVDLTGDDIADLDLALVAAKRAQLPLLSVRQADFRAVHRTHRRPEKLASAH